MIDNLFGTLQDLWTNIYNADSWARATLILAIFITFIVSSVFTYRMARYKDKDFLDWMILLRETGWLFLGFRYATAVGLDWEWGDWSWTLWTYMAITTVLALFASQREHYIQRYKNRGPRWRVRNRQQDVEQKDNEHGNA